MASDATGKSLITGKKIHEFNAQRQGFIMSDNQPEPTLEQRKVIYRARRGLKELDYYFDPYVRAHYLKADSREQQIFAELVKEEDPDLLDWFLHNHPTKPEFADLIAKLKSLKAAS